MNIVIIMSGGVGSRFGSLIPKQYNLIAGKPVIDYVIDAVEGSHLSDKVIVVMDKRWINYSSKLKDSAFDIVPNGKTRLESLFNGLKHIDLNYLCDKIIVVDSVAPFLYSDLIDEYFTLLDTYDCVITSQKITGGLTDIDNHNLDRDNFIITQSPEGFHFKQLWENYDINFAYQETAGMLPEGSTRCYYYNFHNNLKLTYDYELFYAENMLQKVGRLNSKSNVAFFEKDVLITEGLQSYLLRTDAERTLRWLDEVYLCLPTLISKWEITSFLPNQTSRFGLVLQAISRKYENVIIKFIPDFIGRYERELEAFRILPKSYMCPLLDTADKYNCMLLKMIPDAKYTCFSKQDKLGVFFNKVIGDAVEYSPQAPLKYIPFYIDELKDKRLNTSSIPYCRDEVIAELDYAICLYENSFLNSPLYVLHGDLHELNILDDGDNLWGIDPNGMLAPIEIECVRYIRNHVRNCPKSEQRYAFYRLLNFFSQYVDRKNLIKMFIIDMAFCTYNSVFENEHPDETNVNLKLIQFGKDALQQKE